MIYRPYELFIPLREHQQALSPEGYKIFDITREITACVSSSGVKTGQVNMHTLHTTCALSVQEYEKGLAETDFLNIFRILAPSATERYRHNNLGLRIQQPDPKLDPCGDECLDGHAHCLALLLSQNITLNIENGVLVLGKWQNILFIELNGNGRMERTVSIHVRGEKNSIKKTPRYYMPIIP